jgi:multidrug efflux pump subunit AcrA (membrane-fusion protein)
MSIRYPVALLFFLTLIFSCKPKKTENLEEMARLAARPEAVLVKTVKLEKSTFYHELISNGKVSSSEKAVVPFKINGIIHELKIQNGQKVKAGDLLAVIDDFDYKTQLTRAKQGLEKAEINFRDDLLSNFTTSDTSDLPAAKIKISRIRSGLNDAITALAMAEYNYSNTRVFSPISGVVANLEAKQWNPSQNYKNLCSVFFDETMEVQFSKPVPDRLVVPKEALVIRQGKDVIFIRHDSLAIWKYVTVEFENSARISIKEGL